MKKSFAAKAAPTKNFNQPPVGGPLGPMIKFAAEVGSIKAK